MAVWGGGAAGLRDCLLCVERRQSPCHHSVYRCNRGAWSGAQEANGSLDKKQLPAHLSVSLQAGASIPLSLAWVAVWFSPHFLEILFQRLSVAIARRRWELEGSRLVGWSAPSYASGSLLFTPLSCTQPWFSVCSLGVPCITQTWGTPCGDPTYGRRAHRGVVNSGGTVWIQIPALPLSSCMTPCQFTPMCLTYFICRMGRTMVPPSGVILINVINRLNVLRLESAGSGLS